MFIGLKKKGQSFILMPASSLWHYLYNQFKKDALKKDSFKQNFRHKILNLKPRGFIHYNNKQSGYVKIHQKSLNLTSKQICSSGLGSNTKYSVASPFRSDSKAISVATNTHIEI